MVEKVRSDEVTFDNFFDAILGDISPEAKDRYMAHSVQNHKRYSKSELSNFAAKAMMSLMTVMKDCGMLLELVDEPPAKLFAKLYKNTNLLESLLQSELKAFASEGGKAKAAKYRPLKELAAKLVNANNFKSRRNAAMKIKQEIIAESKKLNIPLSEAQAEITITNWLKEMGLPANI